MTLTLILIRHAKSDWGDARLSDHDRHLNARGIEDAPRVGTWLEAQGYRPDHVLCSTATSIALDNNVDMFVCVTETGRVAR